MGANDQTVALLLKWQGDLQTSLAMQQAEQAEHQRMAGVYGGYAASSQSELAAVALALQALGYVAGQ